MRKENIRVPEYSRLPKGCSIRFGLAELYLNKIDDYITYWFLYLVKNPNKYNIKLGNEITSWLRQPVYIPTKFRNAINDIEFGNEVQIKIFMIKKLSLSLILKSRDRNTPVFKKIINISQEIFKNQNIP